MVFQAKFKLEDPVREALCLPAVPRRQCMHINIKVTRTSPKYVSISIINYICFAEI